MKNKISRRSFLAAAAVSAAALAVTGCDAKTSKKARNRCSRSGEKVFCFSAAKFFVRIILRLFPKLHKFCFLMFFCWF